MKQLMLCATLRTLKAWTSAETDAHKALIAENRDDSRTIEYGEPDAFVTASWRQRESLKREADALASALPRHWEQRRRSRHHALRCRAAMARYVALETLLGRMRMHAAPTEKPWDVEPPAPRWQADRAQFENWSDDALAATTTDAASEYHRLQFAIRGSRIGLVNRVELSKLNKVPQFSWSQAWSQWKTFARESGKEARSERKIARDCERELAMRAWERERAEEAEAHGPLNVSGLTHFVPAAQMSPGWELPEEQAAWTARDMAAMAEPTATQAASLAYRSADKQERRRIATKALRANRRPRRRRAAPGALHHTPRAAVPTRRDPRDRRHVHT